MRRPSRLRRDPVPVEPEPVEVEPVEVDLSEPLPAWVRSDGASDPDAADEWRWLRARRRARQDTLWPVWVDRPRLLDVDGTEVYS